MRLGNRGQTTVALGMILIVVAALFFFIGPESLAGGSSLFEGKSVIRCKVGLSAESPQMQSCIDKVTRDNKWDGAIAGCLAGAGLGGYATYKVQGKTAGVGLPVKGIFVTPLPSVLDVDVLPSDAIPVGENAYVVEPEVLYSDYGSQSSLQPLAVKAPAPSFLARAGTFLGGPGAYIATTSIGCLVGGGAGYYAGGATADLRAYLACPSKPHITSISCIDTGQKALVCPKATSTLASITTAQSTVYLTSDKAGEESSIPLFSRPVETIKSPRDFDKLTGFVESEQTICTDGSQIRATLVGPENQLYDSKIVQVN